MNIVQLIEKVRHLRDITHSPRTTPEKITEDIRTAIDDIIRDRYDNFKLKKSYSFQSTQNLRDQLGDLVKNSGTIVATGTLLPKLSFPVDYRHIVVASVNIDNTDYWAIPKTYDELRTLDIDPFQQPSLEPPAQVYYNESELGLTVKWGNTGVLMNGYFFYIKEPVQVSYGIEYDSTHTFAVATPVIAVEITVYAGNTYQIGDAFTIAPLGNITSGLVVAGWVGTDLPLMLHEEICKKAASVGLMITENWNKTTVIEKESEKQ